jgi:hypothetical protein
MAFGDKLPWHAFAHHISLAEGPTVAFSGLQRRDAQTCKHVVAVAGELCSHFSMPGTAQCQPPIVVQSNSTPSIVARCELSPVTATMAGAQRSNSVL